MIGDCFFMKISTANNANPKLAKRAILVALSMLAALLALYAIYQNFFLAATVNGSPITRLSVVRELETTAGERQLDELIVRKLIDGEAAKAGVVVSKEDIDADLDIYKARLRGQGATLQDVLIQLGPHGVTETQYRDRVAQRLRFEKLLEKLLGDRVTVSDSEIDAEMSTSNRPEGMTNEDARIQVKAYLRNRKFGTEGGKWLAEIRSKADVKFHVWYANNRQRVPVLN
jgi:hypothetical protein